jgi:hypothetical protein
MAEKLSIGRQGSAVEPMAEPLRSTVRRVPVFRPSAEAERTDQVELSWRHRAVMVEEARLEALAAAVEGHRYAVPADVLSGSLIEEHLAASALWRRLETGPGGA